MLKLILLSTFSFVLLFSACKEELSQDQTCAQAENLGAGTQAGSQTAGTSENEAGQQAGQVEMQFIDFSDMSMDQDPVAGSQDME